MAAFTGSSTTLGDADDGGSGGAGDSGGDDSIIGGELEADHSDHYPVPFRDNEYQHHQEIQQEQQQHHHQNQNQQQYGESDEHVNAQMSDDSDDPEPNGHHDHHEEETMGGLQTPREAHGAQSSTRVDGDSRLERTEETSWGQQQRSTRDQGRQQPQGSIQGEEVEGLPADETEDAEKNAHGVLHDGVYFPRRGGSDGSTHDDVHDEDTAEVAADVVTATAAAAAVNADVDATAAIPEGEEMTDTDHQQRRGNNNTSDDANSSAALTAAVSDAAEDVDAAHETKHEHEQTTHHDEDASVKASPRIGTARADGAHGGSYGAHGGRGHSQAGGGGSHAAKVAGPSPRRRAHDGNEDAPAAPVVAHHHADESGVEYDEEEAMLPRTKPGAKTEEMGAVVKAESTVAARTGGAPAETATNTRVKRTSAIPVDEGDGGAKVATAAAAAEEESVHKDDTNRIIKGQTKASTRAEVDEATEAEEAEAEAARDNEKGEVSYELKLTPIPSSTTPATAAKTKTAVSSSTATVKAKSDTDWKDDTVAMAEDITGEKGAAQSLVVHPQRAQPTVGRRRAEAAADDEATHASDEKVDELAPIPALIAAAARGPRVTSRTKTTADDDAAGTEDSVVAHETEAGIEIEAAGPAQRTEQPAAATKSAAAAAAEAEGAAAEAADAEAEEGLGLVEVDAGDASDEDAGAAGAEVEADNAGITASPRAAKVPGSWQETRKEASAGAAGATVALKASEGHDEELSDSDARTTRYDIPSPSDEEEEGSYDARTHTRPTTAAGAEGEEEGGTAATAAVGTTSDMDAVRDEKEVATERPSYV